VGFALAGAPPAPASSGYTVSLVLAPDPDVIGDPVTILGTLSDGARGSVEGVRIVLYHRVNPHRRFTPVQLTRTGPGGFFAINRAEGVVVSNREWYVRALAADGRVLAKSAVSHEHVYAALTLQAGAGSVETGGPVVFTGTVSPVHRHGRVVLERQIGADGDSWRPIASGRIHVGGAFRIVHRFRRPGEGGQATIRASLPGDRRNVRSFSEPVEVSIEQAQDAHLTLSSSAPRVGTGESVRLSGTLVGGAGGSAAGQTVTLYAQAPGSPAQAVATTVTGAEGAFSFVQAPAENTTYRVTAAGRQSQLVFEGVRYGVTAVASATSGRVGQAIVVTGTVIPARIGQAVYLQVKNAAGHFQSVQVALTVAGSAYTIHQQLQSAGVKYYRVFVPGGTANLSVVTAAAAVSVAPATSLPALEPTPSPGA
jgi:hypothetical protein